MRKNLCSCIVTPVVRSASLLNGAELFALRLQPPPFFLPKCASFVLRVIDSTCKKCYNTTVFSLTFTLSGWATYLEKQTLLRPNVLGTATPFTKVLRNNHKHKKLRKLVKNERQTTQRSRTQTLTGEERIRVLKRAFSFLVQYAEEHEFVLWCLIKYGRFEADKIDAVYRRMVLRSDTDNLCIDEEITLLECMCYVGVGLSQSDERFKCWFELMQKDVGGLHGARALCNELRATGNRYQLTWQKPGLN